MDITGKAPAIVCNEISDKKNIINSGSDIDLTFTENATSTYIYGISVGNGKWEVYEIDDSLNLFPEYSEGDIIPFEAIKKAIMLQNISQSKIFSFNLLGKVKYGLKDVGRKFDKKTKPARDWFTDNLDKETAQEFLRKSYPGANVGYLDKLNDIDGANYKVLFGVPSEKKFYVGTIHRNGNDIRLLDKSYDESTPLWSFTDPDECLKEYENYQKEYSEEQKSEEKPEEQKPEEEQQEEQKPEEEKSETDFSVDEEGNVEAPNKGYKGETDGIKWEVTQGLKKKRKSKYNGLNVTGYDDGTMLNMASSSFHVFSRLLCSNIVWQNDSKGGNYVPLEEFGGRNHIEKLKDLGFEIVRYGKIVRPSEPSYNQSKSDLVVQFRKPGEESIGTINIKDSVGLYKYSYKNVNSIESYSIDNLDTLNNI